MPKKASLQESFISVPSTVVTNRDRQAEVMRYSEWLVAEKIRRNSSSLQEESRRYIEAASKPITLSGKEFRPFAPFQRILSAHKTLTYGQTVVLFALFLGSGLGLLFYGVKLAIVIIAMITFMYLGSLLLDFWLAVQALRQAAEEQIDEVTLHALADADWPGYTILCPLYREVEVVPQFVRAMQALDYPSDKLQILFLTEEDDVETREVIKAMHLPPHFSVVTVPAGQPRTKPRACNFGLLQATGDYVVIYDAEDIPDPLQLKKAVLTFANHGPDLACVQAKLNYYNSRQNLLTRYFTVEYSLWFDLILPGMQKMKLPLPLGGTSNHFSMEALHKVGAWDPFNVTEDCDLGLRLANSRLKTVVLDSTTYEEANSQVKNWIRQRSRWIKGYLLTYLVYMRQPLRYLRRGRLREFLSLQLVIGGKTAVLLVNPLVWTLLIIYILFRPNNIYHALFPTPVFYMGTLCLVFGNFFYTYIHLIGCMKRGHYNLVKWALFIPIYWVMMSVAAYLALFQLIFKPHYWEKTKHGLHLHTSQSSVGSVTVEEESKTLATMSISSPALTSREDRSLLLPVSHTPSASTVEEEEQDSIVTMPLPALTGIERRAARHPDQLLWRLWLTDPWFIVTLAIACIASIGSCWHFFQQHQILLYNDAIAHMRISRRVVDGVTPGFAQLGGVWLPLPQILMLPFIWNDGLWRTGLAGSFPSMLCYLVATVYLFFAARRLTQDSRASFVGTLLFIVNPNILYLQSTPLSEVIYAAMSIMACYYFLAWTQDNHLKHLIWMGASVFLATLVRFDGWGLFLVLLVLIAVIGWIKLQHRVQIEGTLLVFGTLAGFGIGLWFLWDWVIFNDPLYFHHYLFSSEVATGYYTYYNLPQSIISYLYTSMETVGPILLVLAAIAIVVFVVRYRLAPAMLGGMAFLTPFVFYILVFFFGQDTVFLPGVDPAYIPHFVWNVRFGAQSVAPVALFIAVLAERRSLVVLGRLGARVAPAILVMLIGIQTVLIMQGGIISLQDGLYGASCAPKEPITVYLAQHYGGGKILEDVNAYYINEADIGVELKDTIYEGSGELWKQAIHDPATTVDWIIVQTGKQGDPLSASIDFKNPNFLSHFALVIRQPDGLRLYHRIGRPPLPTRPLPYSLLTHNPLCKSSGT